MKRRKVDTADVLFVGGVLCVSGGVWWMTDLPGAALAVIGLALAVVGLLGVVR